MPQPMLSSAVALLPWATNAGARLQPDISLAVQGWAINNRVPARVLNWLHGIERDAARAAVARLAGSFSELFYQGIDNGVFIPAKKMLVGFQSTGNNCFTSSTGATWFQRTDVPVIPSTVAEWAVALSGSIMAALGGVSGIVISPDGGDTWTAVNPGGIVASGIATAYPHSNKCIAWRASAPATRHADIETGTYSTPTTDINSAGNIRSLCHVAGDVFMAVKADGTTWKTVDAGDNWIQMTSVPSLAQTASIASDGSRVVCMVSTASPGLNVLVYYSDDAGTTWTAGAPDCIVNGTFNQVVRSVRALGAGCWIATGRFYGRYSSAQNLALISLDGGDTWSAAPIRMTSSGISHGDAPLIPVIGDDRVLLLGAPAYSFASGLV